MVDQFDPSRLRHDLLRRMVVAEAPETAEEPGVLAKCAEEIQIWFCETPLVRQCRRIRFRIRGNCSVDTDASRECCTGVPANGIMAPSSCSTAEAAAEVNPPETGGAPSRSCTSPKDISEGAGAPTVVPCERVSRGFPARAICGHVCAAARQSVQDLQMMLFIDFPAGSPYRDCNVEALFQWHNARRWWLCFDWSAIPLMMMLFWDVLMNPPYRTTLVLLFYAAFGVGILIRKILLFAVPSPPRTRRMWHNILLCSFFFGRCIVCQPLTISIFLEGYGPSRSYHADGFSSLIGLGMTWPMVFMQQMQTLDMLLFCIANGIVFVFWILYVVQMPLSDALHTAYVGSIAVTAVCVRQQRDLEDMERRTFERELLHARGLLLRSADRIATRATSQEFGTSMEMLKRFRRVEHLHF